MSTFGPPLRGRPRIQRLQRQPRRGTTTVEFAIAGSICLFFIISLILFQLAVFRYHQIAQLAHEGARWAAVHGNEYESVFRTKLADEAVFNEAIKPRAHGLSLENLSCQVTRDEKKSTVSVTVTYDLVRLGYFPSITVSCTSHMLVSF